MQVEDAEGGVETAGDEVGRLAVEGKVDDAHGGAGAGVEGRLRDGGEVRGPG